MGAIKGKGTKPEKKFAKILRNAGLHYYRHYGKCRIDFAIPSIKLAIFIDGCFWHNCPNHGHIPKTNMSYWVPKLERNKKRDKLVNKSLKDASWTVLRIWEHELKS